MPKLENDRYPGVDDGDACVADLVLNTGDDAESEGITPWEKAMIAFTMLTSKVARTPFSNTLIQSDLQ